MQKRAWMMGLLGILLINLSSAVCILTPSIVNQDPITAVPGETVKVIFQIRGIENPECGLVSAELIEDYPFSLEPGYNKVQTIEAGTYVRDYNSFWIIPYKLRVDSNALDGDQVIHLKTGVNSDPTLYRINDFNISVEEVRTDFIITLDSYSFSTNKMVLGILNTGEKSAQAITVEIPTQDNAVIEGGHVKILGELDSNEDTIITFDAVLNSGSIQIKIEYNDEVGERRSLTKEVVFSEIAFESTRTKSSISATTIILWIIVIGIIVYLYLSRRRAQHHLKHLIKHSS